MNNNLKHRPAELPKWLMIPNIPCSAATMSQRFVKLGAGPKTISPSRTWGLKSQERQCQRLENTNTNKTVKKQLQFLQFCFTFRLKSNIFSGGVKGEGLPNSLYLANEKLSAPRDKPALQKCQSRTKKTCYNLVIIQYGEPPNQY